MRANRFGVRAGGKTQRLERYSPSPVLPPLGGASGLLLKILFQVGRIWKISITNGSHILTTSHNFWQRSSLSARSGNSRR
jgi:hypothetical protein